MHVLAESLKDHIKRRAGVIAERLELELTVAGTEYAPLERAVFKATKNNTKTPKEKHVLGAQTSSTSPLLPALLTLVQHIFGSARTFLAALRCTKP